MEVEDRLRLGMERRIEQAKSELAIRTQQLEGVSPSGNWSGGMLMYRMRMAMVLHLQSR